MNEDELLAKFFAKAEEWLDFQMSAHTRRREPESVEEWKDRMRFTIASMRAFESAKAELVADETLTQEEADRYFQPVIR